MVESAIQKARARELINTVTLDNEREEIVIIDALRVKGFELDIQKIPIGAYDRKVIINIYRVI